MRDRPLSVRPRRIFVDTSGFVALIVSNDKNHDQARAILNSLSGARLYTTNFVLAETHAYLIRFVGHGPARSFLRSMDKPGATTFIRVRSMDEVRAKDVIYRHQDKDYSFVDALSFVVMERLGISHAFAFDQHFVQYGVQLLS